MKAAPQQELFGSATANHEPICYRARYPHSESEGYNGTGRLQATRRGRRWDRNSGRCRSSIRRRRLTSLSEDSPIGRRPARLCFVTWRTCDSIPQPVLRRWHADRELWLVRHNVDPKAANWKEQLHQLDRRLQSEFAKTFSERWHRQLDACHGNCVLRRQDCSAIVADSLLHFDGSRYELTDFIVMPNHVHLLVAFTDEEGMLAQCEGWKRFPSEAVEPTASHQWSFSGNRTDLITWCDLSNNSNLCDGISPRTPQRLRSLQGNFGTIPSSSLSSHHSPSDESGAATKAVWQRHRESRVELLPGPLSSLGE